MAACESGWFRDGLPLVPAWTRRQTRPANAAPWSAGTLGEQTPAVITLGCLARRGFPCSWAHWLMVFFRCAAHDRQDARGSVPGMQRGRGARDPHTRPYSKTKNNCCLVRCPGVNGRRAYLLRCSDRHRSQTPLSLVRSCWSPRWWAKVVLVQIAAGAAHKEAAFISRHRRTTSVLECRMRLAPGHTRLTSSVSESPPKSTFGMPSIVSASRLHRDDAKCSTNRPRSSS